MKNPFYGLAFILLTSLCFGALTACGLQRATPPPSSADVSEPEISEETLRTLIVSLNKRYESIDGRIAANTDRIDALQEEIVSLRRDLGVLAPAHRPSSVPESATVRSVETPTKKAPSPAGAPSDPKTLYDTALSAYSQGDYPTAISHFESFISSFPSNDLADNAFYWIGESYYAKEDFERAISHFLKLVDRYPHGNKVPDALFKIGLSYARLKNPDKARAYFTRVMDNYPFSDAARKAETNLAQLE
jgi:tol-pal system protein YbgF